VTATSQDVRETWDGEDVIEIHDGEHVGAPDLDEIERMYEEAKACIAEATGWPEPETAKPWPETEAIDVRAIRPPAVSRMSTPAPDATSSPRADESPHPRDECLPSGPVGRRLRLRLLRRVVGGGPAGEQSQLLL
jgi:hypothetical protein